jgi:hypothetical protein
MLFDLQSGRRKTVVRVVYAFLAVLFGGGLLFFGVGSGVNGGLFDALGIGGGSDSSSSPQYDQQIENAENKLAQDPKNPTALLDLVHYHYLSATQGIETDPQTGQVAISEDARGELEDTAAAWEDYLKTKPDHANVPAATNAAAAYRYLNDFGGAATAQEVVADAQKTASSYYQLAQYLYADFQYDEGDAAAQQAVAAAEPSQQDQLEKNLAAFEKSAMQYEKRLEKAQKKGGSKAAEEQLQNPFGGLGTGGP